MTMKNPAVETLVTRKAYPLLTITSDLNPILSLPAGTPLVSALEASGFLMEVVQTIQDLIAVRHCAGDDAANLAAGAQCLAEMAGVMVHACGNAINSTGGVE